MKLQRHVCGAQCVHRQMTSRGSLYFGEFISHPALFSPTALSAKKDTFKKMVSQVLIQMLICDFSAG